MNVMHDPFNVFFAHHITSTDGIAYPAIFLQDPNKPGIAKLLAIHYQKKVLSTTQCLKIAHDDLAAAIKSIRPIAHLSNNIKGSILAFLYKRGYAWPGPERIEITLPTTSTNETDTQISPLPLKISPICSSI